MGVTPVSIPNTMVKPQTAYGTMLETAWESGWLPDSKRNKSFVRMFYIDVGLTSD